MAPQQQITLILLSCIQSQLAKNTNLYVWFFDFSHTFDLINRGILFYKLMGGFKVGSKVV